MATSDNCSGGSSVDQNDHIRPDAERPASDKRSGFLTIAVRTFLIIFIFVGCSFMGLLFIPMITGSLFLGWIGGFLRIGKGLIIEPRALAAGLTAMLLFVFFLHRTIRCFDRNWSLRKTSGIAAAVFAFVFSSMAIAAAIHECYWLEKYDSYWLESNSRAFINRFQTMNQFKKIALGVGNYSEARSNQGALPHRESGEKNGELGHSLATYLLPYLGQSELYQKIRLDRSWTDPGNRECFKKDLDIYSPRWTEKKKDHYNSEGLALCGFASNQYVFRPDETMTFKKITDGTSNTIILGEVEFHKRPWGDPVNARDLLLGINKSHYGFGNSRNYGSGAQFAFADGTVRFISNKVDPKILKTLATPDGGEKLDKMYDNE